MSTLLRSQRLILLVYMKNGIIIDAMIEKIKSHILAKPLEYGAVPLAPWQATDPRTGENYVTASTRHVSEKLQRAMFHLVADSAIDLPERLDAVGRFMEVSLYDTQMRRIDLNAKLLDGLVDNADRRVKRAKRGVARPDELFGILVDYPKIESIELAKLSHPFDEKASTPMDIAVYSMLESAGAEMLHEDPRYKMKRVDETIPAGIVLRKEAMANLETDHGTIQVVRRESFLVRADEGVSPDPYLGRKIKNPERIDELKVKIEAYLSDISPELMWLQSQATSYYAKYLPEAEAAPEFAQ